jgi:hypothetical protein
LGWNFRPNGCLNPDRHCWPTDWGILKPYGRIEYSHDFAESARTRLGYANLPGLLPYGIDVDASSTNSIRLNSASTPTFFKSVKSRTTLLLF